MLFFNVLRFERQEPSLLLAVWVSGEQHWGRTAKPELGGKWSEGAESQRAEGAPLPPFIYWKVNRGEKWGQLLYERGWGDRQMEKSKNAQRRWNWGRVGEQRKGEENGNEREHQLLSGRQETMTFSRTLTMVIRADLFLFHIHFHLAIFLSQRCPFSPAYLG